MPNTADQELARSGIQGQCKTDNNLQRRNRGRTFDAGKTLVVDCGTFTNLRLFQPQFLTPLCDTSSNLRVIQFHPYTSSVTIAKTIQSRLTHLTLEFINVTIKLSVFGWNLFAKDLQFVAK